MRPSPQSGTFAHKVTFPRTLGPKITFLQPSMKTLGRQIVPRLCMQRDPDSGSGGSGRLWESSGWFWDIQYVTAVTAPCSNCPLLAAARCFGNQVSSRAGRSGVLPQCPAFPPPCAVAKHDGTEVTQNLGFFACTIGAQSDGRAFVRRCGVDGASTRPTLDVTSDVTTPTLVEPRCRPDDAATSVVAWVRSVVANNGTKNGCYV